MLKIQIWESRVHFLDLYDEVRRGHQELVNVRPDLRAAPPLPLQELLQDVVLQGRRQGHARRVEQAARDRKASDEISHQGRETQLTNLPLPSSNWDILLLEFSPSLQSHCLHLVSWFGRQAVGGRRRPHCGLRVRLWPVHPLRVPGTPPGTPQVHAQGGRAVPLVEPLRGALEHARVEPGRHRGRQGQDVRVVPGRQFNSIKIVCGFYSSSISTAPEIYLKPFIK